MDIAKQIDSIIEQRKSRLPMLEEKMQQMLEEKMQEMDRMLDVLADLEYMKNQMIDGEGTARTNGKYAVLLQQNPESTS